MQRWSDFKPCRKRSDSRRWIKIFTLPLKNGSRLNYLFIRVPSRSREFTKVSLSTECSRAHRSTKNLCERNGMMFSHFARLCLYSQIKILIAHVFAQGRRINETANKVSPSKNAKCQHSNSILIINNDDWADNRGSKSLDPHASWLCHETNGMLGILVNRAPFHNKKGEGG